MTRTRLPTLGPIALAGIAFAACAGLAPETAPATDPAADAATGSPGPTAAAAAASAGPEIAPAPARTALPVDFAAQVQPILETRCMPCHFEGGKMYAELPFDQPVTILVLGERLFTRIKEPAEQETIRAFLAQAPVDPGEAVAGDAG